MSKGGCVFIVRIYIAALTLLFLLAALTIRGIGPLEAIVVTCPLLYLILDTGAELHDLKALEAQVLLLSENPVTPQ